MTRTLEKYHARSPRYILQPQDDTLIRLAGPQQTPWEEGTELRNISLTGLVFTAPADLCPNLGETVKIEYRVPGGQKMAAFALVARLENFSPGKTLVGVQFFRLDFAQRLILTQGLALKLRSQQEQQWRTSGLRAGIKPWLLPGMLALVLVLIFYSFSSWSWLLYLRNEI